MSADGDESFVPENLGDLLEHLMDSRGYASLSELGRHTSIPYQTLWSWKDRSRNLNRPPAVRVLRKLAADFALPEALVFRAAGRAYPVPGELPAEEQELLHAYRELTPADQATVQQLMRNLASRPT